MGAGLRQLCGWPIEIRERSRFAEDRSGSAAIEFAIVATPFFFFIFGIFQVALYHFSLQALDYATREASRKIMTAQVSSAGMTGEQFKANVLCPALVIPLDCGKITVSVKKVAKVSDKINKTGIYAFLDSSQTSLIPANLDASAGTFCTGGAQDYLFIDVAYKFQNYIKLFSNSDKEEDKYWLLRSTNFIYNEPFSTNAGC